MQNLNDRVRNVLRQSQLPTADWAVLRLREDVEIIAEVVRAAAEEGPVLAKRAAESRLKQLRRLEQTAAKHGLGSVVPSRRVELSKLDAEMSLLAPPRRGRKGRFWLQAACRRFLETWEELAFDKKTGKARSAKVHQRAEPSPALRFVCLCCRIIDPSVSSSAITKAARLNKDEPTEEKKAEAYEAWCETPQAKRYVQLLSRRSVLAADQ
jgi:hypothetical protein